MATTIWTNMVTYLDIHTVNDATNLSREEAISSLFTHLEMYCYNLMLNTLKEPSKVFTKETQSNPKQRQGTERDNQGRFKSSSPKYLNLSVMLDELFIDPSPHDAELLDEQSQAHHADTEIEIF